MVWAWITLGVALLTATFAAVQAGVRNPPGGPRLWGPRDPVTGGPTRAARWGALLMVCSAALLATGPAVALAGVVDRGWAIVVQTVVTAALLAAALVAAVLARRARSGR